MGSVLISTRVGDPHAIAVAAELRRRSFHCDIWHTHLFPGNQRRTFRAGGGGVEYGVVDECFHGKIRDYTCIWHRRPTPPTCDPSLVHPNDRQYVVVQNDVFHKMSDSLLASANALWPEVRWVNEPGNAIRAESKLLQLALASSVDFPVPDTIISNNPEDIRGFIAEHGATVSKSLFPYSWTEDGAIFGNNTNRVGPNSLPSDQILSSCPEIYQKEIARGRELRLFFAGPFEYGVEIRPVDDAGDLVDWRVFHRSRSATRALSSIPAQASRKCRELMGLLGLVTASIDLLEDHEGRLFFVDLNQAGQFLWMESFGLPVLEAFVSFLIEADNFQTAGISPARLSDLLETPEFAALEELGDRLPAPPPERPSFVDGGNKEVDYGTGACQASSN